MVGRAPAGRLAELGHDVVVGTRDVEETLARTDPDAMGNPPYAEWQYKSRRARVALASIGTFVAETAAGGPRRLPVTAG
jgi:predicted dinucleotide-binding enzyme